MEYCDTAPNTAGRRQKLAADVNVANAVKADHGEGKFAAREATVASEGFTHIRRSTFHSIVIVCQKEGARAKVGTVAARS